MIRLRKFVIPFFMLLFISNNALYSAPVNINIESKLDGAPLTGVPVSATIDNNSNGNGSTNFIRVYDEGLNFTLTAPANHSGSYFQKWQKDGGDFPGNNNRTYIFTADAGYTVTALYRSVLEITSSASDHGSISPPGTLVVAEGGSETYTIVPDSGYIIGDVYVDGVSAGDVSSYTFNNITEFHTIQVYFLNISDPVISPAYAAQSTNYKISNHVIDSGGAFTQSSSYSALSSCAPVAKGFSYGFKEGEIASNMKSIYGMHMSSDPHGIIGMDYNYDRATIPLAATENGLITTRVQFKAVYDGSSHYIGSGQYNNDSWTIDWDSLVAPLVTSDAHVVVAARAFDGLSWGSWYGVPPFYVDNEAPDVSGLNLNTSGMALNSSLGALDSSWVGSDNLDTSLIYDVYYAMTRSAEVPVNVPDLMFWFDAKDPYADGTRPLTGTAMDTWSDKSGNGYDAYQNTPSKKPLYDISGINFYNDYFGVDIDVPETDYTLIMVFKTQGSIANAALYSVVHPVDRNASANDRNLTLAAGKIRHRVWNTEIIATTETYNDNKTHTVMIKHNSEGQKIYMDGDLKASGTIQSSDFNWSTGVVIGDFKVSSPFQGYISEVMFYDRAISETEIQHIQTYLTEKWKEVPSGISGLSMWLDADDPNADGTQPLDGTSISTWTDKSVNGNDISQASSSRQPLYKLNQYNGRPVMRFDGVDDYLINASNISVQTVFIVSRLEPRAPSYLFDFRSGISNSWLYNINFGSFWNKYYKNNALTAKNSSEIFNNSWQINMFESHSQGSALMNLMSRYSNNEEGKGDLAEVIIYDRVLSDTERGEVYNYLNNKYSDVVNTDWIQVASDSTGIAWSQSSEPDNSYFKVKVVAKDDAGNEKVVISNEGLTPDRTAPIIDGALVEINATEDINFTEQISDYEYDAIYSGTDLDWTSYVYTYVDDPGKSAEEVLKTATVIEGNPDLLSFVISPNANTEPPLNGNIYGKENAYIRLGLIDKEGNYVYRDVKINIAAVNDKPVINAVVGSDIVYYSGDILYNFKTDEDVTASAVSLDDFVVDVDNEKSDLLWTVTGNNYFQVGSIPYSGSYSAKFESEGVMSVFVGTSLDNHNLYLVPSSNWYGDTVVTVNVTDNDVIPTYDSQKIIVRVWPVNDPPIIQGFSANVMAYYDFESGTGNGVYADKSGGSRSGQNAGTSVVAGMAGFGNAVSFDGNDKITFPAIDENTVSIWFKANIQQQMPLYQGGSAGSGTDFAIFIADAAQTGGGYPGTGYGLAVVFDGNDIFIPYDSIKTGWHHIIVSWDGGTLLRVGIDGNFLQGYRWSPWTGLHSQPFTLNATPVPDTAADTSIGYSTQQFWNSGALYFDGLIDNVVIWDKYLSTEEMAAVYSMGADNLPLLYLADEDNNIQINAHAYENDLFNEDVVPTYSNQLKWSVDSGSVDSAYISVISGENGAADILSFTPVDNKYGTTNLTLKLTDTDEQPVGKFYGPYDYTPAPETVEFPVTLVWRPVNDPPVASIPDLSRNEDSGLYGYDLTSYKISDIEDNITTEVSWTNVQVDKAGYITAEIDSGDNNNLKITPLSNVWGTVNVTLSITDSDSNINFQPYTPDPKTEETSFQLSIQSVNDLPSIATLDLISSKTKNTTKAMFNELLLAEAGSLTDVGFVNGVEQDFIGSEYVGEDVASLGFELNKPYYNFLWTLSGVTDDVRRTHVVPPTLTGLVLWLDANDPNGNGSQLTNGSTVSTWVDKSGSSLNAVQGISGSRPVYYTDRMSGRPSIYFNNKFLDIPYTSVLNPDNYTVFIVCSVKGSAGSYRSPLTSRNTSPHSGYKFYANNQNKWTMWVGNGTAWESVDPVAAGLDAPVVLSGQYDGSKISMIVDSADYDENYTGYVSNTSKPLRIGAGASESAVPNHYFDGDISEIVIYNRVLSENERVAVEEYLNSKWITRGASSIFIPSAEYEGKTVTVKAIPDDNVISGNEMSKSMYINYRPDIVEPVSPLPVAGTDGFLQVEEDYNEVGDTTANLTISWDPAVDTDSGDSVYYRLKIWKDDPWDVPTPDINTTAPYYDSGWQSSSFTSEDHTLPEATYFWTVYSANQFSPTLWDYREPGWLKRFVVDTVPPDPGDLDNVLNIPELTEGGEVNLSGRTMLLYGPKPEDTDDNYYYSVWLYHINEQLPSSNDREIVPLTNAQEWDALVTFPEGRTTYNVYFMDRAGNTSNYKTFIISEDVTPPSVPVLNIEGLTLVNGIYEAVTSANSFNISGSKDSKEATAIYYEGYLYPAQEVKESMVYGLTTVTDFNFKVKPAKPEGVITAKDWAGNQSNGVTVSITFLNGPPPVDILFQSRVTINRSDNSERNFSVASQNEVCSVNIRWESDRNISQFRLVNGSGDILSSGGSQLANTPVDVNIQGTSQYLTEGMNNLTLLVYDEADNFAAKAIKVKLMTTVPETTINGGLSKSNDIWYITIDVADSDDVYERIFNNGTIVDVNLYLDGNRRYWRYYKDNFDPQNEEITLELEDVVYNKTVPRLTLWDPANYTEGTDSFDITASKYSGIVTSFSKLPPDIVWLGSMMVGSEYSKDSGISLSTQSKALKYQVNDPELSISESAKEYTHLIYGVDSNGKLVHNIDLSGCDVYINLPYASSVKIEESNLIPVYFNENTGEWERSVSGYHLDTGRRVLAAQIDRSGMWCLGAASSFYTDLNYVRVYPNPWSPNDGNVDTGDSTGITFDNLTPESRIRIYTISGQLVRDSVPGTSVWNWDGNNTAGRSVFSGVYLYIITDGSMRKSGKVTVIK